jgi:hypothetical protein
VHLPRRRTRRHLPSPRTVRPRSAQIPGGVKHMATSEKPVRLLDSAIFTTISRNIGKVHTWIYRRTRGRIGGNLRLGAGFRKSLPTLLLEQGRTETRGGIAICWPIPMSTFRSGQIAVQLKPSSLGSTSGRVYGHAWWMPTPTSTRIKKRPSVRSRPSSCNRASEATP